MADIPELIELLKEHLSSQKIINNNSWRIQLSPLGGRGIFANRDIKTGEIILIDTPLLIGPRAGVNVHLHCVVCSNSNIKPCSKGCGLPVCAGKCENLNLHVSECELIRNLMINKNSKNGELITNELSANSTNFNKENRENEISIELFRSLTPLRGFLLGEKQRKLLKSLACHLGPPHGFEVKLVKTKIKLSETDEKFMKIVCSVLDSNAFETKTESNGVGAEHCSLRGLYPIASLLNHSCVPNTTHLFNHKQQMILKATVPISKNTEILSTYSTLLWSTVTRRHHLSTTKHFWCACPRCKDSTEFGACLSGLKCTSAICEGILYPIEPLNIASRWQCDLCKISVSRKCIGILQSALGALLRSVDTSNVQQLINLIQNRVTKIVPVKNQITVDLKLRVIWMLGHTENYSWPEITVELLNFKEQLCRDILKLISTLRLGQCKIKAFILCELFLCLHEKRRRETLLENEDIFNENRLILSEAAEILGNDVTVPYEVKKFIKKL